MFSRLKSALGAKPDTGERAGLRGAFVERLRGMRGGEGAAPPEVVISRPSSPIPPKPIAHAPTPAVSKPIAAAPTPEATVQAKVAPAVEIKPIEAAPNAHAAPAVEIKPVEAAPNAHAAPAAKPSEAAPKKQSLAALAAAAGKKSDEPKIVHADMGSTDIEHYIARAKANGRDLSTIKGGEGLNVSEDGEKFWGPVDNESSRAKAAEKLLTIDQWECISCGTCVEQTDKVFYLPGDAKATPIAQDGPMDLIQDAIEACPVTCIHWVTPDEAAEKGLATGNEPDSPRPE